MTLRTQLKTEDFENTAFKNKLAKVFCRIPFNEFHIYRDGFVSNCCFNWLPTEIGNIHSETILQMMNNKISAKIQKSVTDGSYKFCSTEYCPHLNQHLHSAHMAWPLEIIDNLETEKKNGSISNFIKLYLSFDYSCNLFCESCRTEKIFFDRKNAPELLLKTYEKIGQQIAELLESNYKLEVNITGSGDAFASPLYYDLMNNLPDHPNLRLLLSTNGIMMTRKKLTGPFTNKVKQIFVSVDSCKEDIYPKIRRGGHFRVLENNLMQLDQMIDEGFFPNLDFVQLNFILQKENYSEMGDFVEWATKFKNFHNIFFTKILDWDHLNKAQFFDKAVWMKTHPLYQDFVSKMQDPRLKSSRVTLGNLSEFVS